MQRNEYPATLTKSWMLRRKSARGRMGVRRLLALEAVALLEADCDGLGAEAEESDSVSHVVRRIPEVVR